MTKYEELISAANKFGVEIREIDLGTDKKCGRCLDNIIYINSRNSDIDKYEILSEELGHFKYTFGNITNLKDVRNLKQEYIARSFSYKSLVGITKLIEAHKARISNHDLADYLGVTEQFLIEALSYYERKYGNWYSIDNYIIRFNPLGVIEKFQDF